MPSADRICVYGDSHIGSVKRALDAGLLPELEGRLAFWGAAGPAFRGLRLKGGRIVPDAAAVEAVAKVRGDGPETLGPGDFDAFVFYAARMRIGDLVLAMQRHEAAHGPVSQAVMEAAVGQWLGRIRAYRFAQAFAGAGARIAFVPASFPTTGVIDAAREAELYHAPREAGAVARTLDAVARVGAADGVTLVHQPDDTLTPELMTRAEFAAESARENGDVVHKSPAFAAIMMRAALGALEARAEAA